MKKSHFTEEQIAYALRQAETGTAVTEVCRAMGVSEQTYYRWKKQYGGLGVQEIRRLKLLEEENRKLKQLVADLSLDKLMLQGRARKKTLRPGRRRELVRYLEWTYRMSERRGCVALRFDRSSHRYQSIRGDQAVLRKRIRDLAAARVRYGYFRIYILLRREGWRINHKRVYRLYCEEGLSMRLKRPRRHVMAAHRQNRPAAGAINESWSMDFVSDALFDGRRIRALTVVDDFSRECLAAVVDMSLSGVRVVRELEQVVNQRGWPRTIVSDNVLRA
ncbi:MAG TPA: IS3 family transposase [Candidatus Acidoferrales bacterium]|nr:IS3 family transposase [Candidatus Acidoferrales bacterium]